MRTGFFNLEFDLQREDVLIIETYSSAMPALYKRYLKP